MKFSSFKKKKTGLALCAVVALLTAGLPLVGAHPGISGADKDAPCPFLELQQQEEKQLRLGQGWKQAPMRSLAERSGDGGVPAGGFAAVKADIVKLLTDSQPFWPADFGNYGGLFIRLAWHCAGSYRSSDGRGGCDGGRIRYDPEFNWPDNANLDKALELLKPIKAKYGSALSWGDLIILSGTTAIESMGGPVLGFCGGRIDDADGSDSLKLGPSDAQEAIGPCQSLDPSLQGNCLSVNGTALGPTTVGLIYVNPAGPKGHEGDPIASGADIRRAFGRMGFSDMETVALIGGGHAFGKCHGACPNPPCGEGEMQGKGPNTFTSGFEGPWTTDPTTWTNQYFFNLFEFTWDSIIGPGGNIQWKATNGPDSIMMLTSDIALSVDEMYKPISKAYADDISKLEEDFAKVWYRLVTADMGPAERCIGDLVPPPQPFQNPLPDAPETLPNFVPIRKKIQALLDTNADNADAFINLAYRCASTYRATSYHGGCNGARIRFLPESGWPENAGTAEALATLKPVKEEFAAAGLTYTDLIVLAGLTALEHKTPALDLKFCGGGVDASDAANSGEMAPRTYSTPYITVSDDCEVKGLTDEECVALAARENLSSKYFKDLIAAGGTGGGSFTPNELALLDGKFTSITEKFAMNEGMLLETFTAAWTKMMTADRYLNNRENVCTAEESTAVTKENIGSCPASTMCKGLFGGDGAMMHFDFFFGWWCVDMCVPEAMVKLNDALFLDCGSCKK